LSGVLLDEQEDDGREYSLPPLDEMRHNSDIGLTISHFSNLCKNLKKFLSMIELEPNPYPDGEDGRYVPDIGLTIAHVRRGRGSRHVTLDHEFPPTTTRTNKIPSQPSP